MAEPSSKVLTGTALLSLLGLAWGRRGSGEHDAASNPLAPDRLPPD